jgi:hypothetical protein
MNRRLVVLGALMFVVLALGACSPDPPAAPSNGDTETSPEAGQRLAPGLYDLSEEDGVHAVGTLVWRDLEGGFWAIAQNVNGASENEGENIAVIANGEDFREQLEPLEGREVIVTGERFDGMSIRMAGPEIVMDSVEELGDAGIAE